MFHNGLVLLGAKLRNLPVLLAKIFQSLFEIPLEFDVLVFQLI